MVLYKREDSGKVRYAVKVLEHVSGDFFVCQWIVEHGRPTNEKRLRDIKEFDNWIVEW